MHIGEDLWVLVTTFINFISLSPTQHGAVVDQTPLRVSRPESVPLEVIPEVQPNSKLVFAPPGSSNPDFTCDYSAMLGWEPCSSPLDRKCWLRKTADGSQLDLYTNYEDLNLTPKGIARVYNLTVKDMSYDADGLKFPFAKLFNEQYPGPLIEACWGDTIIVNVTNRLKYNGTSVHWHGVRQLNSMQMDGVNGVTQCPIAPGDSMEYSFRVTQYGTSWYHSHYSVQYADGAAGPMTFHGPTSDDYDDAVPGLIMTDWGHNSAFNASFINGPGLDRPSILLNGRGNVSHFGFQNTSVPRPPYNMTFEPANSFGAVKRYLIRIMNTSFQKTFIFSIDNHILEVVSADFVPIVPYRNTTVLVGIGQRYDIIIEARPQIDPNNPVPLPADNNYWIRTTVSDCNTEAGLPNGTTYEQAGILRYDSRNTSDPKSHRWENFSTDCSDESYHSLHPILNWQVGPPSNGEEIFTIDFGATPPPYPQANFQLANVDIDPALRVSYTNITFLNLDNQGAWNQSFRVVPEAKTQAQDQWVYIIIRGSGHPIHLHGHDFAILNQSSVFDLRGFECGKNLNCNNPPRRDVVLTSGYTVIAFKMDNPGAWLVHCHIAFHIAWGLGMQILENQARALELWPPGSSAFNESSRVCDNWKIWYDTPKNWWPVQNNESCSEIEKQFGGLDYCFQEDSGV